MSQITMLAPQDRSLLFVCPAWQRVDLAAICYAQWTDLCTTLRKTGLYAHVLVVADDDNLDAAREHDFSILEHENKLGGKLNAGYMWAAEGGFDYVCPIGNDSFIHPDRFTWLPGDNAILCSRNYTAISPDGTEQIWFQLDYPGGAGSRVYPLTLLERLNYRPLPDNQMSGCDTETLMAICRGVMRAPDLIYTDLHPYELLGFQSPDVQVTKWQWWQQHPHTRQQPFDGWPGLYPAGLADRIRDHYAAPVAA